MLQYLHLYTHYKQTIERFVALHNLYHPTNTRSASILAQRVKHIGYLLEYLQNPQDTFRVVHVTGTSGKGTVVSLLHSIVQASGARVGSIVSPHTTTFLERYLLNEKLVSAKTIITCIEQVENAYARYLEKYPPIAFHGLCTVLGFTLFAHEKVDWVILEASLGGRYDYSNILTHTEASVITGVDKDHTEILGNTLEEIAYEKAGIIKEHGLVIVGEERPRLRKIFTDEAIQKDATLFFTHTTPSAFESSTLPNHMNQNIRIATRVAEELDFPSEIIKKGIEMYHALPCRFETVSVDPLIILDGAHNPAKIQATINHIKQRKYNPIILFGTGSNKDAVQMLQKLHPIAKKIYTTRTTMDQKKAENPFTLLKMVPASKRGIAFLNPHDAISEIIKILKKDEVLIVTGSLYITGEIRTQWYKEEDIVKQANSYPI